jgi:hypothetical protein
MRGRVTLRPAVVYWPPFLNLVRSLLTALSRKSQFFFFAFRTLLGGGTLTSSA